ncbi:MAG: AAA family ATPase [Rhodothermales bacterium]
MYTRFADLLHAARQRLFVGRQEELDLFDQALTAVERPYSVLFVHGPGGVGKTSLLHMFAERAKHCGWRPGYIDTRTLEPSPDAMLRALGAMMGAPAGADVIDLLNGSPERHVLLFDTTETIRPLDWWLRERFLPALSDRVIVVFAGRFKPSVAWRIDPGWQALVRAVPLRNLSTSESLAYLQKRQVPDARHRAILSFTHGYPLALSLMSDMVEQRPDAAGADASPDIVQALLTHFLDEAPGPEHRRALYVCAAVRQTTEQTLRTLLDPDDAHGVFEWLRTLSFIDAGPAGLFPHDMARQVLVADLQWREPDWHAELHRRARTYYIGHLQDASGPEMRERLIDFLYLHRENPLLKPIFTQLQSDWNEQTAQNPIVDDALGPDDIDPLVDMVAHHEGDGPASWARRWLERQPEHVRVYRDGTGRPLGMLLPILLTPEDADLEDPAVAHAMDFLRRHAPLREGECAVHFRFWMSGETYQDLSLIQSMCFIQMVRMYLTIPGLAFSFLPCADPDLWKMIFAYVDLHRFPDADYPTDRSKMGVYGHDWRVTPPAEWLSRLASRVPSPEYAGAPAPAEPSVFVLSREDFLVAVREALKAFSRPERLRENPLLRSRLVIEAGAPDADAADRIQTLCGLLDAAAATLDGAPRDRKLYRALEKTYLKPAPSQEIAAEQLGVPYSTFRRHLMAGVDRVAEMLWQREIGE